LALIPITGLKDQILPRALGTVLAQHFKTLILYPFHNQLSTWVSFHASGEKQNLHGRWRARRIKTEEVFADDMRKKQRTSMVGDAALIVRAESWYKGERRAAGAASPSEEVPT
jgi:hypothetical protein